MLRVSYTSLILKKQKARESPSCSGWECGPGHAHRLCLLSHM